MRIITGSARGCRLKTPKGADVTRPTADRVKESLFNILGQMVAGRKVLDIFAGTGNLGLEALSRGAESAVFVDKATEKLMGVGYEPVAVLATEEDKEEEGTTVTCFLCRGTVVYPGAKPYYVLMYVRKAADGEVSVQNIWELWIEPHSKKEE